MEEKAPKGYMFYRREFLNPPGHHTIATILAAVEECCDYAEPALTMSDCTRTVQFSFPFYDKDKVIASLYKIRKMKEIINEFAAVVEEAAAVKLAMYEEEEKQAKAKETKKESKQ